MNQISLSLTPGKTVLLRFVLLTAICLLALSASASTTISTDINTEGTLTVTGISNLKDKIYNSFGALMLDQAGQANTNIVLNPTTGNVGVGTTSPQRLLTTTNSGGNEQIMLEDTNASADQHYGALGFSRGIFSYSTINDALATTTRITINKYGGLGIGTTSPAGQLGISTGGTLAVQQNNNWDVFNLYDSTGRIIYGINSLGNTFSVRHTVNTVPAGWNVYRDRGGAIVNSGDYIAQFSAVPYDGTAYREMASIKALIDSTTVAETNVPTAWIFSTGNTTSASERMRISSAGLIGIGNNTPTYKLDVTGNGHFTTYVDARNFVATSTTATSTFTGATFSGLIGIGTTTPTTLIQAGSTATTTISALSSSGNKGGRLILMDTNGTTCTEITTNAGAISSKAVTCP